MGRPPCARSPYRHQHMGMAHMARRQLACFRTTAAAAQRSARRPGPKVQRRKTSAGAAQHASTRSFGLSIPAFDLKTWRGLKPGGSVVLASIGSKLARHF